MKLRVALVGCGNMGSALARGLLGRDDVALVVCDRNPEKVAAVIAGTTATAQPDPAVAVRGVDAVLLAVKPGAVEDLLRALRPSLGDDTLVISCAAGLSLATLRAASGPRPLARTMPNTGAAHAASTTAYALSDECELPRDRNRLLTILEAIGEAREVRDEDHMHHATALAGSGPAFFLLALEAMADAGLEAGLTREEAELFARGGLRAASALADREGDHPAVVRARITSPGGTTIAGLGALEKAGARAAFADAVGTALRRSRQMGAATTDSSAAGAGDLDSPRDES